MPCARCREAPILLPMIPGSDHQRWFMIDPAERPPPVILLANLVLAAAAVSFAARISIPVPGSSVPQSLQTLAVVLTGMWMGPTWAPVAMLLYLGAGAAGLPLFADGASGLEALTGPTAGYLVGFVIGAGVAGWSSRRSWISPMASLVWMSGMALVAHGVILLLGSIRLVPLIGIGAAFSTGVSPFLLGGIVKSMLAAGIWIFVEMSKPPD